jgi:type III pantothenate kinase
MLLAIDAGNTQTVVGLFALHGDETQPPTSTGQPPADPDAARARQPRARPGERGLLHHWRMATDADRTADEHALLVADLVRLSGYEPFNAVTGAAISSTVPRVQGALRDMAHRWFGVTAVVLGPGVRTGMPILYESPRDVGADRIANAVAALDLYQAPIIVVDFGTATTFDVVSPHGEYLGGVILPGIEISLDALFARASMLRRVEMVEPRHVVGRSTIESIQSGAIYGFASMTDGMCRRIEDEVGRCTVVATGGLAELMAPYVDRVEHLDPWLTLHGLRLIWERNCGGGAGVSG